MKKVTIVLTITSLAAALFSAPAHAQNLPSAAALAAKNYDPTVTAPALADGVTANELALISAINAARVADGVAPLAVDVSLMAAARYQEGSQLQHGYTAPYGVLTTGADVSDPTMAADFGSQATAVAADERSNGNNFTDTGNWPALVADWQSGDQAFKGMLTNTSVNVVGVSVIDTGIPVTSNGVTHDAIKWVAFYGNNAALNSTGPVVATSQLNQAAVAQAVAAPCPAPPASPEGQLLTALNAFRNRHKLTPLHSDPSLTKAAHYLEDDQMLTGQYGLTYAFNAQSNPVGISSLTSDFGSPLGSIQMLIGNDLEDNGQYLQFASQYTGLGIEWYAITPSVQSLINDPTYNACGIAVATGPNVAGTNVPLEQWCIVVGK